jgi:hypothetical protein
MFDQALKKGGEKMNEKIYRSVLGFAAVMALLFLVNGEATAKKPVWDGIVKAPLKSA